MSITVATVALNAADDLPITLESVLSQDFDDLEVLVVDGASWDDTPEVLARYADAVDRIEVVEDSGVYDAMNRAAELASKDFILFLNAGDYFHTARALSKLWSRKRESADIVYGNHIYRDGGVDTFRVASSFDEHMAVLRRGDIDLRWLDRFPAHQATLTRTALLRQQRYDTSFRICADHEFLLRAVAGGAEWQYVDEIIAYYIGGGLSARRNELTRLEWNAAYRLFSERPDRVDKFFYGDNSPFRGSLSPYSGELIAGLFADFPPPPGQEWEVPEPFRWASGAGIRVLSPVHRSVKGLFLRGYNQIPRQGIEIYAGTTRLAVRDIPEGSFGFAIPFSAPVPPRTVLDVLPRQSSRIEGVRSAVVSFALIDFGFDFLEAVEPVPVGTPVLAGAGSNRLARLLSSGWWAPEPMLVWSREDEAVLRLSALERVGTLVLRMRANPVVRGQRVEVVVNDGAPATHGLGGGEEVEVTVPVHDDWRADAAENIVVLRASERARPNGDPRELGVALVGLELRT